MTDNPIIVDALMIAFTAAIVLGIVVALLKLRTVAPRKMQQRLDREVAKRLAAMSELARNYGDADPYQQERLLLNYRFHRAAVMALAPATDVRAFDTAFGDTRPSLRAAA